MLAEGTKVGGPNSSKQSERRSKIDRVIEEQEFPELGPQLERRWTKSGGVEESLHELADFFNREVLAAALADAGQQKLGEVNHYYDL